MMSVNCGTTLHLMVGLPCAGKTTLAKQLEREQHAVRFTPDQWQLKLFGQDFSDPDHRRRHNTIEKIMWEMGRQLLQQGISVILDFGFLRKEQRDYFRREAKSLGVHFQMHFLNPSMEVLRARLEQRNRLQLTQKESTAFIIPLSVLEEWSHKIQYPDQQEISLSW